MLHKRRDLPILRLNEADTSVGHGVRRRGEGIGRTWGARGGTSEQGAAKDAPPLRGIGGSTGSSGCLQPRRRRGRVHGRELEMRGLVCSFGRTRERERLIQLPARLGRPSILCGSGSFGVPNWQPTQPNVKQSMRCACAPVRCFSFSPTSAGLRELSRRT